MNELEEHWKRTVRLMLYNINIKEEMLDLYFKAGFTCEQAFLKIKQIFMAIL